MSPEFQICCYFLPTVYESRGSAHARCEFYSAYRLTYSDQFRQGKVGKSVFQGGEPLPRHSKTGHHLEKFWDFPHART